MPDGTESRVETLTVDGAEYGRLNEGPWVKSLADSDGGSAEGDPAQGLKLLLESLADLEDMGEVTKMGRTMHYLQPRGGSEFDPSVLGLGDPDLEVSDFGLDVYTEADGTPVVLAATAAWELPAGEDTVPAVMTVEFVYDEIGGPVSIERPTVVWYPFTSEQWGYTVAVHPDWDVAPSQGEDYGDEFLTPEGLGISLYTEPNDPQLSLNELAAMMSSDFVGGRPATNEKVLMGNLPARVMSGPVEMPDGTMHVTAAVAVDADRQHILLGFSMPGREAGDLSDVKDMVTTYRSQPTAED
jgi:hypothetical protein